MPGIDAILLLFFSFTGVNFLSGMLSLGIVGAIVYTVAKRFQPYDPTDTA
jgi:hypothetical protein